MDSGEHAYCACGAQWHGYVVEQAKEIIAAHQARWPTNQFGCGAMSHATFARQFRCNCSQCAAERMVKRKLRRGAVARPGRA